MYKRGPKKKENILHHVYVNLCFCFPFLHAVMCVLGASTPTCHVVNIRVNPFRLNAVKETQPVFSSLLMNQALGSMLKLISSHFFTLSIALIPLSVCELARVNTHWLNSCELFMFQRREKKVISSYCKAANCNGIFI